MAINAVVKSEIGEKSFRARTDPESDITEIDVPILLKGSSLISVYLTFFECVSVYFRIFF